MASRFEAAHGSESRTRLRARPRAGTSLTLQSLAGVSQSSPAPAAPLARPPQHHPDAQHDWQGVHDAEWDHTHHDSHGAAPQRPRARLPVTTRSDRSSAPCPVRTPHSRCSRWPGAPPSPPNRPPPALAGWEHQADEHHSGGDHHGGGDHAWDAHGGGTAEHHDDGHALLEEHLKHWQPTDEGANGHDAHRMGGAHHADPHGAPHGGGAHFDEEHAAHAAHGTHHDDPSVHHADPHAHDPHGAAPEHGAPGHAGAHGDAHAHGDPHAHGGGADHHWDWDNTFQPNGEEPTLDAAAHAAPGGHGAPAAGGEGGWHAEEQPLPEPKEDANHHLEHGAAHYLHHPDHATPQGMYTLVWLPRRGRRGGQLTGHVH